jgi:26S proteasome regulatory subunit N5
MHAHTHTLTQEANKKKSQVDMVKLEADIAAAVAIGKAGKLHDAVEALLNLEKTARLAEDITATKVSYACVRPWRRSHVHTRMRTGSPLHAHHALTLRPAAMHMQACCAAILASCFDAKDWKMLEEQIVMLSKRRSQLKQAIQAFVRQSMTYIDEAPSREVKVALIKTLQAVTEGKVRARACVCVYAQGRGSGR